ncbi:hypothetical protein NEOLEDRAFT_381921 [Neolentinus lepideus HHB14362 ss-1]|uniref:Uncharacterized protein n=1 Tax=Neolentinus lepideus HHB14362 ss-1 TaxID=1314782 RepID=A0A165SD75_9AGAM|nr:hypothetical protein NEOLEDRAFT_381921 [Neolentinus lepideus HHB14362 ss-1]
MFLRKPTYLQTSPSITNYTKCRHMHINPSLIFACSCMVCGLAIVALATRFESRVLRG